MSIDFRAIVLAGLLLLGGAAIVAVSTGGGSGDRAAPAATSRPMDTSDRERFPWVLEERGGSHLIRTAVKDENRKPRRFPTKEICRAAGQKHRARTGKQFRCRHDPAG